MYWRAPWSRVMGRSVVSARAMRSSYHPTRSPGAPAAAPSAPPSTSRQPCTSASSRASPRASASPPPSSVVRHSMPASRSASRAPSDTAARGSTAARRAPAPAPSTATARSASAKAPITTPVSPPLTPSPHRGRDGRRHLDRARLPAEIRRAHAPLGEHPLGGGADAPRRRRLAPILQQRRGGEDDGERIGPVHAHHLEGRAVYGLVDADADAVIDPHRGGDPAHQPRAQVAQEVAVEVARHQHV